MKEVSTKEKGARGEKAVEALLRAKGWTIIERNFFTRTRGGRRSEIDIIAFDAQSNQLVFVEVKVRNSQYFVSLASSLHRKAKREALIRGARTFLNKIFAEKSATKNVKNKSLPYFSGIRFDYFFFQEDKWHHIQNAFTV